MSGWWLPKSWDVSACWPAAARDGADAAGFAARLAVPVEPSVSILPEELTHSDAVATHLASPAITAFLAQVCDGSPYLRGLCLRDPSRLAALLRDGPEMAVGGARAALETAMIAAADFSSVSRALRVFKCDVALATALADIGGLWSLEAVTGTLSDAADTAIAAALEFIFAKAHSDGRWLGDAGADGYAATSGMIVLGMGKYGARELNYSSDVDLIVFFDREKAQVRDGLDAQQFFVRVVRDLTKLIQEQTSDGYVFRVDLRLRPDPGSTQVAISSTAALIYYETYGQNWERAAFIKARPVAGDFSSADALLNELEAYVWRKYFDFAAVSDVHAMKRQINTFKGFRKIVVRGHDIK
ncbi:MAG: bifunctional [glutamine synthetase] adenylyltransferase/[glutamine synthetase]-adenylyl-L-tyrosine phosphorylase, partial [Pseudomonadota bacterium]